MSADTPSEYYKLRNLCICNEEKDLGYIPYLNWGIGYKASIDENSNNKWKVFVHAGLTKEFIITPETNLGKLVTLIDFVNNVDECKEESDLIPVDTCAKECRDVI